WLKEKLPESMVPSAFVLLDGLPLSPNGKVDRKALPAPGSVGPPPDDSCAPPPGSVEETVARIWAEVLGVERVGVRDNFFDLGGHSLLATQVLSRLRQVFPVDLPLRRLFEEPTVANLARAISESQSKSVSVLINDVPVAETRALLSHLDQMSDAEIDSL